MSNGTGKNCLLGKKPNEIIKTLHDIATGNFSRPTTIGYTPEVTPLHNRAIGDTWNENGTTWQKIGNTTKASVPLFDRSILKDYCKVCNKDVTVNGLYSTKLDWVSYRSGRMCHDCLIEFETKIKLKGIDAWRKYENKKLLSNQLSYLKDCKVKFEESIESIKNRKIEYVNETGPIEEWLDEGAKEILIKQISDDLENIKVLISRTEENLAEYE